MRLISPMCGMAPFTIHDCPFEKSVTNDRGHPVRRGAGLNRLTLSSHRRAIPLTNDLSDSFTSPLPCWRHRLPTDLDRYQAAKMTTFTIRPGVTSGQGWSESPCLWIEIRVAQSDSLLMQRVDNDLGGHCVLALLLNRLMIQRSDRGPAPLMTLMKWPSHIRRNCRFTIRRSITHDSRTSLTRVLEGVRKCAPARPTAISFSCVL